MSLKIDELSREKLEASLDQLELPVRPYNALRRAGIDSVQGILCLGLCNLKMLRNFGDISYEVTSAALASYFDVPKGDLLDFVSSIKKDMPFDQVASLRVSAMGFSLRARSAMNRAGISRLQDLLNARANGILRPSEFDDKTLSEIDAKLESLSGSGFHLDRDHIDFAMHGSSQELNKLNYEGSAIPKSIASIPISVLELSSRSGNALDRAGVKTLEDLLNAKSDGLSKIRGIGESLSAEIEKSLRKFLETAKGLSCDEIDELKERRVCLIEGDFGYPPNLIENIEALSKQVLCGLGHPRDFEVLKRRYGFERSGIFTLQEVGYYYDISRERVRQIESRAEDSIRDFILGEKESDEWKIPGCLVVEANELSDLLNARGPVLLEGETVYILQDRYDVCYEPRHLPAIRFLLQLFGFEQLAENIAGLANVECHPVWLSSRTVDKKLLCNAIRSVYKALKRAALPLSVFDITVRVNKRRKHRIPVEYIQWAVKGSSTFNRGPVPSVKAGLTRPSKACPGA